MRVDPPFQESDVVKPIRINQWDMFEDLTGKEVLISGWGDTKEEEDPDQLQSATLKVSEYKNDHPLNICMFGDAAACNTVNDEIILSDAHGVGACHGDSGGIFIKIYHIFNITAIIKEIQTFGLQFIILTDF